MGKHTQQANTPVAQQATVAALVTVAAPTTLRAQRIAKVQVLLHSKRIAAKQQAYHAAQVAHNQQAYMLAVQQLAVQYGVAAPTTLSVRNAVHKQQHAPSAASGACAQVHAIAAANNYVRAATLAACKQAGINPATAATQYAIAKRNYLAAQNATVAAQ